jgi:hypothetical protein
MAQGLVCSPLGEFMMSRWQPILGWAFAILCALLCIAAHLQLDYTVIDDAFITYRYSARLATGDGLTYNDGERVLGTTTPGYALLIAGVGAVGGVNSIPLVARLLNMTFLLIAGGCAVLIADCAAVHAKPFAAGRDIWLVRH